MGRGRSVSTGSLRSSAYLKTADVKDTVRTNGMRPGFWLRFPIPHPISRFQRKKYAPIEIVLTEKKGFGLRAAENLSKSVLSSACAVILVLTCFFPCA